VAKKRRVRTRVDRKEARRKEARRYQGVRPALFAVHPTSSLPSHPRPPTSAQLSYQPLTHFCRSANTYEESRPSKGVFLCVWLAQTAMGLTGVSRRGGVLFSAIAAMRCFCER